MNVCKGQDGDQHCCWSLTGCMSWLGGQDQNFQGAWDLEEVWVPPQELISHTVLLAEKKAWWHLSCKL